MDAEREQRAKAQQQRAEATLRAIFAGGHLASEAEKLANDFTDDLTSRATGRWRKTFGRRPPHGDKPG